MSDSRQGGTSHPTDPAGALGELLAGNRRFVEGRREHPNQDADRRALLTSGQQPFALVLGCSDSRVAAEIVFDRGLGDLFVVRTAGHVVDDAVLGSVEFGVDVLGIPLIVVLGHDGCGAVRATIDALASGSLPAGHVRRVVELVGPSIVTAADTGLTSLAEVVAVHARQTARSLRRRSASVDAAVARGDCLLVAMEYTLADGRVHVLDPVETGGVPG